MNTTFWSNKNVSMNLQWHNLDHATIRVDLPALSITHASLLIHALNIVAEVQQSLC